MPLVDSEDPIAGVRWRTDSPLAYGFGAVHTLYLVVSREGICVDECTVGI